MKLGTKIKIGAKFSYTTINNTVLFTLEQIGLTKEQADAIVTEEDLLKAVEPFYLKWLLSISSNIIEVVEE